MSDQKFNRFSVPLGLLDYVNPIFYTITMLTLIKNIGYQMVIPYNRILFIGAAISIFFGLIIPTLIPRSRAWRITLREILEHVEKAVITISGSSSMQMDS